MNTPITGEIRPFVRKPSLNTKATSVSKPARPVSNVIPLCAQANEIAQEMIESIRVKDFTLDELNVIVNELPKDLKTIISLITSELHLFNKHKSSTFVAVRHLAVIAANIAHNLENAHV